MSVITVVMTVPEIGWAVGRNWPQTLPAGKLQNVGGDDPDHGECMDRRQSICRSKTLTSGVGTMVEGPGGGDRQLRTIGDHGPIDDFDAYFPTSGKNRRL